MTPGEDGLSLTRYLAEHGGPPVILLTAKTEIPDCVVGLEIGAQDYVVKPFSPRELVARIKVALRRGEGNGKHKENSSYAMGFAGWTLRLAEKGTTTPEGTLVPLSSGEFRLLEARRNGRVRRSTATSCST